MSRLLSYIITPFPVKKLLILFAVALLSTASTAQNKFIEVVASDTAWVKPQQFTYSITTPSFTVADIVDAEVAKTDTSRVVKTGRTSPGKTWISNQGRKSRAPEPQRTTFSDLKMLLSNNSFTYEVKADNAYTINSYSTDSSLQVTLTTEAELKRLYNLLAPFKQSITAKISNVKMDFAAANNTGLYKRLYEKALAGATAIAQVSGNTVGSLISVEEPKDLLSGLMDLFKSWSSRYYNEIFGMEGSMSQPVEKKLLFRFEMK